MTSATKGGNGRLFQRNPHIAEMQEDVLFHLALSTQTHDLKQMFGDIKFVVVGGSATRMERFANMMLKQLDIRLPAGQQLINISGGSDRYSLFKAGPVLAASHGIGIASCSVVMHELIKVLQHAGATNVIAFRIGTCGGLGVKPGTVVVSNTLVDGLFRPYMEMAILGNIVTRPATLNTPLLEELVSCTRSEDDFQAVTGTTMCTTDFYEGQGRLDGAFCEFSECDKMQFLKSAHARGVRNVEMESICFASMCHHAGVKCAVACAALLDRFQGDQVQESHETLTLWEERPAMLVARLIRRRLGLESAQT